MGISNRQRRRAKQWRRQPRDHRATPGASRHYSPSRPVDETATSEHWPALVDRLVTQAAHAGCAEDAELRLAPLLDQDRGAGWTWLVTDRVTATLTERVTLALLHGWEPRDISALVRRKVGADGASVAEAVLPEAVRRRRPEIGQAARWQSQLEDMSSSARLPERESPTWESDISAAVAAIGLLGVVGALPDLGLPHRRSAPRPDIDESLLEKVRALLAKAEATDFEEEADAFLTKAQELMARYNLDRAALEKPEQTRLADVEARRCWLDDPYLKQKGNLLAVVGGANRCRSVSLYQYGFVTIFGHPDDLDTTEMLFTALLVHAIKHMTLPRQPVGSNFSTRSYRSSFLLAYAHRIGARLRQAVAAATEDAVESTGEALLPVLASRKHHADEALRLMFPHTTRSNFSATDPSGWAAGRAAADLADLSGRTKLTAATA